MKADEPHTDNQTKVLEILWSISDQFRFAEASIGLPPLGSEKAFEFNYGLQLTPLLSCSASPPVLR
jgi:hypothetical protein